MSRRYLLATLAQDAFPLAKATPAASALQRDNAALQTLAAILERGASRRAIRLAFPAATIIVLGVAVVAGLARKIRRRLPDEGRPTPVR